MGRLELAGWSTVGVVCCVLAIPWFLWGDSTVVAGLPLWLWWHVGWMGLVSVVFWTFAQRAWGLGIETGSDAGDSSNAGSERGPESTQSISGGDRP